MVEGGGKMHTQFLTDDLADELQLVVAPFFVGDSRAPRFVSDGLFPGTRPACDARRGLPDRRCGAAALRALATVPDRLTKVGRAHARRRLSAGRLPGRRVASRCAEEAVAEGVHRPDRRLRAGPQAVLPAPPGDLVQHRRVVGDDRDRHVVARRPAR